MTASLKSKKSNLTLILKKKTKNTFQYEQRIVVNVFEKWSV